jgi:ADP-ribose pyrophosphatase
VSEKKDLAEHFVSGELVYDGTLLKVRRDLVRLPDGSVLLERQFRYPHRREFIEIPAGKLEPGEPPLDTAKRELAEETGHAAAEWTAFGVIHTAIAYTDEAIHLFLARKLTKAERKLDQGEFLECFSVPFNEALRMIRDGEITDAKTVAALLWVGRWRRDQL